MLEEREVQGFIDQIFPSVDVPDVATHFIMSEDGAYRIRELEHRSRSVLLDVLEISGETGVLRSDIERYQRTHWKDRAALEIPLPQHAARFAGAWGRIERGTYPMILPDEQYNSDGLPLGFSLPDGKHLSEPSFEHRAL